MPRTTRKRLTLGLFALALGLFPFAGQVSAQAPGDRAGAGIDANANRTTRDEGFNFGWLGLLGLAGLAGLMPKKTHAVTTHRPGDATVR